MRASDCWNLSLDVGVSPHLLLFFTGSFLEANGRREPATATTATTTTTKKAKSRAKSSSDLPVPRHAMAAPIGNKNPNTGTCRPIALLVPRRDVFGGGPITFFSRWKSLSNFVFFHGSYCVIGNQVKINLAPLLLLLMRWITFHLFIFSSFHICFLEY